MPKNHSSSEKNRKKSKKPCKCNKTLESPKYICSKCNEKIACEKASEKIACEKIASENACEKVEMKRDPPNIFITFVN
jgi:hypothetical protein